MRRKLTAENESTQDIKLEIEVNGTTADTSLL